MSARSRTGGKKLDTAPTMKIKIEKKEKKPRGRKQVHIL
jgi:hypothetical protein